MLNIKDEPEQLVSEISDLVEVFVNGLKQGKLGPYRNESLSTTAAVKAVMLMADIVRLFQTYESMPTSTSIQMLRAGYPAVEVASQQISRLLILIGRTSDALLRSQFGTLLLVNVTRRVLALIRESAASNTASEKQLEEEARETLSHLPSTEELAECEEGSTGRTRTEITTANTTLKSCVTQPSGANEADEMDEPQVSLGSPTTGASTHASSAQQPLPTPSPHLPPRRTRSVHFEHSLVSLSGAGSPTGTAAAALAQLTRATNEASGASAAHSRSQFTFFSPSAMLSTRQAMSVGEFTSPLLQRTGSIVASEIPGQQMLRRAPSKRDESSVEAGAGGVEFPVSMQRFYQDALDGILEFKNEIESMTEELCRRAKDQLHSSDTVMTLGCSHTIRRYLLQAASEQHYFKVIILEGAPALSEAAQSLAAALREEGLPVMVLPDSSAFAVMNMCTKIVVGAESVLANGGMLAPVGTHLMCIAARQFAVPVLVTTTTLKMSPYYPSDQLCTRLVRIARSGAQEMPWATYGPPDKVLPLPFGIPVKDGGHALTVYSPTTEYVPPELITLYATNDTEFTPSQIHRIVRANYSDVD